MAALDTTTYPLTAATEFQQDLPVMRDRMSDRSLHVREIGQNAAAVTLVFAPMDASTAESFIAYVRNNQAVETSITHKGSTYDGYFWGPLRGDEREGNLTVFTVDFRGVVSGA